MRWAEIVPIVVVSVAGLVFVGVVIYWLVVYAKDEPPE